jgi:lipopolysaccharide biosynthesis protein
MAEIELLDAGIAAKFVDVQLKESGMEALSADPQIIFKPAEVLRAGWYRIYLDIIVSERVQPQVYFDFGDGFHEVVSTLLRPSAAGGYSALVRLPFPVLIVRLDPARRPCQFTVSSFRFKPQAPHERALALGRQAIRVMRRNPRTFLRRLPAYLKVLRHPVFFQMRGPHHDTGGDVAISENSVRTGWIPPEVEHVPLLKAGPLAAKPARVIAFYLPQFHAIPENDEWWGKGFTEWTNVKPAKAQFVGHYQPHLPGELGYYSLLDKSVQRRQIELAKLYGLEGFCFYFYWFNGKRLLEKPVEAWLGDASLDLPFCLCWANENWSRRWDGLEKEVLIGQDHSPEDDLAFIGEVARYMTDPRYIRIDGKPLLLIYRPSLLPDPEETAARWRQWCRENGVGEIFLAYTQSFEIDDPGRYGFDAAIEFPPNNSAPPNVTDLVRPLQKNFSSTVYDWSELAGRSSNYVKPNYRLFRSVCPGWDNTARRKTGGTVLINNTPNLYRRWIENAVAETVERVEEPSERLVFVNAWNEWAEGAHLEPDAANGYAYLQATRDALENVLWETQRIPGTETRTAIVIHAFYPEILNEILELVVDLPKYHKLFVTTTEDKFASVDKLLAQTGREYDLRALGNRGRDILPFVKIFPTIRAEGFELLAKVHTKKSLHRGDGDVWRQDLYRKLLEPEGFRRIVEAFAGDPSLGMVGPDRHYVPMSTYLGSNEERIGSIGKHLKLTGEQIRSQGFFAGTMFVARISALEPLMDMGFTDEDFEPEEGQIDGTLAHAIERGMALSVASAGMRLASNAQLQGPIIANERYGFV